MSPFLSIMEVVGWLCLTVTAVMSVVLVGGGAVGGGAWRGGSGDHPTDFR